MITSNRTVRDVKRLAQEQDAGARAHAVVRRLRHRPLRMEAWPTLRPHALQSKVWQSKARFIVMACGRGSGKTELARRKLVTQLPLKKPWSNPLYFYAMPTYMQAKRVGWKEILRLIPPEWILERNVMDLYIKTIFGSELYVAGLDRPQRIEGSQYDFGVIDECSDVKPGAFRKSVIPALSTKNGSCWLIGVPKRNGIGSRDFKDLFDLGNGPNQMGIESYQWPSSSVKTEAELAVYREGMTDKDYEEQFNATWVMPGGLVYYAFDRETSVINSYEPDYLSPLYIGQDFNVNPMCWVIAQKTDRGLVQFDELFVKDTNTPECLKELHKRHGDKFPKYVFCGDAASRQRKTNGSKASKSDYALINNFDLIRNKVIKIPDRNPPVDDRQQVVNGLLKDVDGNCRFFVTRNCKKTIQDLEYLSYKENTSIVDDSNPEMGHISDALGYLIWQEYPMKIIQSSSAEIGFHAFA